VIESAERRREKMQYQAAVSRWNEGEAAGCQRLLMALLGRRADFRDARRLLADVCLARHDLPEAELHLRILLEQDPNDAQTHHSLGLLLEESGRRDEALFHLDRAAGLEPANELYALSRDAAQHTWH
jgi:predicted Zn-dependent protease